jgi:hypothetical protein
VGTAILSKFKMNDFFLPTVILVAAVLAGGFLYGWLQAVIVATAAALALTGLAYFDSRCKP